MTVKIGFAQPADMPSIVELLTASNLPEAGLSCRPGTIVLVAREDGGIVGCAALELYGEHALLRSVAVSPGRRGEGLGDCLTESALDIAGRLRLAEVYLLTDGAESFFARHGFAVVERQDVPQAVTTSPEFTTGCCSCATAMSRRIAGRSPRRASGHPRYDVSAISLHDLAPVWGEPPETSYCS